MVGDAHGVQRALQRLGPVVQKAAQFGKFRGEVVILPDIDLQHRRDDPEYVSAVNWLAGQVKLISAIRKVTWREGYRGKIPTMPQTKDTGLIYAFHLVVLHEVLKALGYRGLALIIDEAEHVRTYSINRYFRANNFFDVLARCAHPPRNDLQDPHCDYDMTGVPPFWREGPHFGLFVGLTEGEDTQDLKRKAGEMSVLIHSPDEVVHLAPPSAADYEAWATRFLTEASSHLGPKVDLLSDPDLCAQIAAVLRERFEQIPDTEKLLRNWTKMAGLPAAVLLSQSAAVLGLLYQRAVASSGRWHVSMGMIRLVGN